MESRESRDSLYWEVWRRETRGNVGEGRGEEGKLLADCRNQSVRFLVLQPPGILKKNRWQTCLLFKKEAWPRDFSPF